MPLRSELTLTPTPPFHFADTVYSHGWAVLTPNSWHAEEERMRRVLRLQTGRVVLLTITGRDHATQPAVDVAIDHEHTLSPAEQQEIRDAVAHMLRLDEDLTDFYALCAAQGGRWSALAQGRGRLLRSPTVFEDVVKTICTTNIQWGGTKRMIRELVVAYGEPLARDGAHRAFPTPEALAAVSQATFEDTVNLGYRAAYVHELAQHLASGALDLEALANSELPTPALKKELLDIKGVGNYAAATLLMLLGRYDELPVDSVFRQFVTEQYFDGTRPSDTDARAIYADWGQWKYLAYWLDMFMEDAADAS